MTTRLHELRKKIAEEKTRFEQTLEEMGFESVRIMRLTAESYNHNSTNSNGKSNGHKDNAVNGFATTEGTETNNYTRTYMKKPEDQYSNEPKICLELEVDERGGTIMNIHSIPWLKSYNYEVPEPVNRKEILRLLKGYLH